MRRWFRVLPLLGLALATLAPAAQAQLQITVKHNGTTVPVNSTFDYGSVLVGTDLTRTFAVTNVSSGTVVFTYGLGGDAANPIFFRYGAITGATLAPGASGTFELIFNSPTARTVTNQVRLFVNGVPHYEFWVRATATSPLGPVLRVTHNGETVTQGALVDWGSTGVAAPLTRTFTAHNDGDQPLTVAPVAFSSFVTDPARFSVVANSAVNVAPGASAPITLSFDAAALGTVTSEVDFFVGGVSRRKFSVRATTAAPDLELTATPTSRTVTAGGTARYTVSAAGLFGFSGNVALALTGLPPGASVSFQPASISTGSSSTLRVFTNAGTPAGARSLTITGTSGSVTRSVQVNLVVNAPPAAFFNLSATPTSRTVNPGQSTTYSVAVQAVGSFTNLVSLSATGLPAGASASFAPAAVAPGTGATLTVATALNTPAGSHPITLHGSGGGHNATVPVTLVVSSAPAPTGVPTLDTITPNEMPDGVITRVVLQGSNFHGAAVSIATEPANPGDPTPTAFPVVTPATVSADGRTMEVDIDARAAGVRGFYTLVVSNSLGGAAIPFRVLPTGPVVDAWSPSEPMPGRVYSLLMLGANLDDAVVTVSGGTGVNVHGVLSNANQLSGFLEVTPDAPLGPRTLTVRVGTRQTTVSIEVVASSSRQENNLTAEAAKRAAAVGRLVPEVYLQEVQLGPDHTFARAPQGATGAVCNITLGWDVYSYAETYALPFDPTTGRIVFTLLRSMQLGVPIPAGVEILSVFVDLLLQVRLNCFPFSHLQFCLYGNIGYEIPGVGGQIFTAGGCFLGGTFFPTLTTTGSLSTFEFSTPGQCSTVQQTTLPGEGGIQEAVVTLNSCCTEPLQISVAGRSFTGTPYQWSFQASEVAITDISPAPSQCGACSCSVTAPGIALKPGESKTANFTVTNLSPSTCTFNWAAQNVGGGATVNLSSSSGSLFIAAGQTQNVALGVTLPTSTGTAATPQVRLSALGTSGDSVECAAVAQGCVIPTDETTRFLNRPLDADLGEFGGQLVPSLDWSGKRVTENPAGSGTNPVDTCYFRGSPFPRYDGGAITGDSGNWIADSAGAWQKDNIGVFGELDEVLFGLGGPVPCRWEVTQHMKMMCPFGPVEYTTNRFVIDVQQAGTVICRDGVCTPTRD